MLIIIIRNVCAIMMQIASLHKPIVRFVGVQGRYLFADPAHKENKQQ